jgi:outer membrane protein TolC
MLKSKATFEVKNQVAAMYEEIAKHKEKMELQNKLLAMAKTQYAATVTNRDNLLTTVIAVKKAELSLLGAQRDTRRLEYELELKYIKLKRLMSADMLTNEIPKA